MSNIPTASTSAASTSSASTSLASTSTSQLPNHPYAFRIEDECTTTDDSEISDDDFQILNSNVIGEHSFLPSEGSEDDASWSSIESSTVSSQSQSYGDENSCSDDSNMYILNGVVIRESDQMTVSNNEILENSSDLASNATWAERTPTHEDSNEAKCPNHDEQNIPMLLYLEIDEIANGLINVAEHEKRLKELEKESEYIEITAWMYRPIDPAIR